MSSRTLVKTTHITLDKDGIAWIEEANTKVIQVVIDKIVWNRTPEEIHAHYPHLTLAQIHAALTYYYDHKELLDTQIEEWHQVSKDAREAEPNPLSRRELEERLQKK